jgi:hypothetical protein
LADNGLIRTIIDSPIADILSSIPTHFIDIDCVSVSVDSNSMTGLLDCLGLEGGGGTAPGEFSRWLDAFRNPDCSNENSIIAQPADKPPTSPENLYGEVAYNEQLSSQMESSFRGTSYEELSRLSGSLSRAIATFRQAAFEMITLSASEKPEVVNQVVENYRQAVQSYYTARDRVISYIKDNTDLTNSPDGIRFIPMGSMPAPGQEESASSARCKQRSTDAARGVLFDNPEFCPGNNFLQCLAEEQDPIRRITGGKCATIPSPAGATMLDCRRQDGSRIIPDLRPEGQEGPPGEDGLRWTDPNSGPVYQGQVHTRYLDVVPLSEFFVVVCSAGGCPAAPDRRQAN